MSDQLFTLEVLNAFHGDCLILHYGTPAKPKLMLIDGGPNGTFTASLKPRLTQLATLRSQPLKLDHVMVSHLDDDHIAGILDVVKEINKGSGLWTAPSFWFNTFGDAMKKAPPELTAALHEGGMSEQAAVSASLREKASIQQGRDLRDAVESIQSKQNGQYGGDAILFSEGDGVRLDIKGLDVTLVCPDKTNLAELAKKWISSPKKKTDTADYVDKSVFNLSSLVVVVRPDGQTDGPSILLTGDARGDHILAGLDGAGFLDNGKAHFSILKVPHHGSDRNLRRDFFAAITADYYVLSGDGKYDNPSQDVLEWITETAPENARICLTYDSNPQYESYGKSIAALREQYPKLSDQLLVRPAHDWSICVDLLTPIA